MSDQKMLRPTYKI